MARVRQARYCAARRTDGQPCKAYAMIGADVCRAHGGAAGQVRRAARRRIAEADIRRAADAAIGRYLRERQAWQAARIARAAELLKMPVSDFIRPDGSVREYLIGVCIALHGEPSAPAPEMRPDRRFAAIRALEAGADAASVTGGSA